MSSLVSRGIDLNVADSNPCKQIAIANLEVESAFTSGYSTAHTDGE